MNRTRSRRRRSRLTAILRCTTVAGTIPIWLPLVVLLVLVVTIASPQKLHLDLKRARTRRRLWNKLKSDGRILSYLTAKARVAAGEGTFVAEVCAGEVHGLWWIRQNRAILDSLGEMPALNDDEWKTISQHARRSLESCALAACSVELPTLDDSTFDEICKFPNVAIEDSWFDDVALTGKVSDPLGWPTGNPASDALRVERDRLLDLKDSLLRQAEYGQVRPIARQIEDLEQSIKLAESITRTGASQREPGGFDPSDDTTGK